MTVPRTLALFAVAAVAEIGGAWLIWQGVREHRGVAWIGAGIVALAAYGFVATLQEDSNFGRILAAYGGIFVAGSLAWGIVLDGFRPDLMGLHRRDHLPCRCRRHHVRPTCLTRLVCQGDVVTEQPLDGGIANAGKVVRVGPHVLRPASPHSGSIHAFLRAVRATGFEGASFPVGVDEDGRERLEFIDGEVPVPPYPDWSQSDAALTSIARLLRGLHDAAREFDPQGRTWEERLADPAGGTLVCHNDVELSNVVFREGIAVALLDFEFAAPGRPVYDLAQLARLCTPIDDEVDQDRLGWRPADRPARVRLLSDAYGLGRDGRADLLRAIGDALDRIEASVRRSVDAGDPNAVALWNRTGGAERHDRRRRWWTAHRDEFADALR